jgi:hypothetical protein
MLDLLAATRDRIGPAPRRLAPSTHRTPTLAGWVRGNAVLWKAEHVRPRLVEGGRLVLGWLVLGNELLFRPGGSSHPALVVYDLSGTATAETLEEVSIELGQLRARTPVDPELAVLARALANDRHSPLAHPVPRSMARGFDLRLGIVLVHRAHLPRPYLGAALLPLLVHDTNPEITILPAALWADDLRSAWLDLAAARGTPSA